ncbi:MAG TPA: NAD(P)/FAD-dependent oxidoreductase [Acidimicrobiia bacterium]|nr:NAD(P)/FAD-dependent oxidoreductase [Acidimicrobiia bacterium]
MTERIETDVVIVGAGLGGLSAARHLQESGHRVVVVEGHTKPGGYAHFFRKEEFRFEVALHALDGLDEGGWAKPMFESLGIMDRVEFNRLEPFYTVRYPDFEVAVPADVSGYLAAFSEVLPHERNGARDLFDAIERVGHDVARYARDRSAGTSVPLHEMPIRYPDMAGAFASSWQAFVDRYLSSVEAKALVSTLWGYLGLPPSKVSAGQFALTLLSYHTGGAWYPTGGSGTMTWAITEVIEENGGQVHLRNIVTSIEPTAEGVTVVTDKGLTITARAVVSNASPTATLGLLPVGTVDPDWAEGFESDVPALSSLVVHLGVNRDLAAEGWNHHEFFDMVGYDLEAEYEAILGGRFEEAAMIVSNYTIVDPTCAPEGGSVLALTTLAPWDHADVWGTGGDLENYRVNPEYLRVKEEAGRVLIDRADALLPGLRTSIVTSHVGTPLTNARYVRQPHGSLYGREQSVANMMDRRSPRTPIPNLFLTGAWIGGGGMTAAVASGRSAAKAASRYLA